MKDVDSVISEEQTTEDQLVEGGLRPLRLENFIGQDKLKSNLKIFIQAAQSRNSVLDHVLLYGPPGLGKTSLAQIIARELGVNFKSTSGPLLTKAADLASIVTNLQKGDVLFIDEIHRLSANVEEVLYPAMEDYKLDLIIGEGPSARSVTIDLSKFTLIGATTRMGLLTKPLRERFGILSRLSFYNVDNLKEILKHGAKKLASNISDDGALEIAKRARGTPRVALRLLKRVVDFAEYNKNSEITIDVASSALEKLEVDRHGLDSNDYRYLRFIADKHDGGPVGVETIAAALAEDKDSIEDTIEPYLIQQGIIHRTPRGRMLTKISQEILSDTIS